MRPTLARPVPVLVVAHAVVLTLAGATVVQDRLDGGAPERLALSGSSAPTDEVDLAREQQVRAARVLADKAAQQRRAAEALRVAEQTAAARAAAERAAAERAAAERAAAERDAAERAAEQAAAERTAAPVTEPAARPSSPQAPAAASPKAAAAAPDAGAAYAAEVLRLVNGERSREGLRPLAASSCAVGFARRWSQRMAETADFSHQALEPVLRECGASSVGENIGYTNGSPQELVRMWMASDGHRANILKPSFTHLGVGASRRPDGRWYATQDFLTR